MKSKPDKNSVKEKERQREKEKENCRSIYLIIYIPKSLTKH